MTMSLDDGEQAASSARSDRSLDGTTTFGTIGISPAILLRRFAVLVSLTAAAGIAFAQPIADVAVRAVVTQLTGKNQGVRYGAIQALLPQIPDGLGGDGLSQILGDPKDPWRSGMVKLIASKARPGLTATETATVLGDTNAGNRYAALEALIPRIGGDLSGQEVNQILGDPKDPWRSGMMKLIASKARPGLTATESATVLGDLNAGNRYAALEALIPRIGGDLSGQEVNQILGDPKDPWRSGMVKLIASKARPGLTATESATVLGDLNAGNRYAALEALVSKIKFGLSAQEVEQIIADPKDSWRPAMVEALSSRSQPTTAAGSPSLGSSALPAVTASSTPTQSGVFDGTYFNEALRFGFRVAGNQGIATVSNSPKYQVGDVMLRFTPTGPRSFSGKQLCTDGVFHAVSGTLAVDGSLDITIQGCSPNQYSMARLRTGEGPAPATASGSGSAATSSQQVCQSLLDRVRVECELLRKLRDPSYFAIAITDVGDAKLYAYVVRHRAEVAALAELVQLGQAVVKFMAKRTATIKRPESEYIEAVKTAGGVIKDFLSQVTQEALSRSDSLTANFTSQFLSLIGAIESGLQVYNALAGALVEKDARDLLQEYFWSRCGGSYAPRCDREVPKSTAWNDIQGTYEPLVNKVVALVPSATPDNVSTWFENRFLAYRLVAYGDSDSIRRGIGHAMAAQSRAQ
jgi:hypothetical protein